MTTIAIVPTRHFRQRLHGRFPAWSLTEGRLRRVLAAASWYPHPDRPDQWYAHCRFSDESVVVVVALNDGLAHLVTTYEGTPGWARRVQGIGLPGEVLLGVSA